MLETRNSRLFTQWMNALFIGGVTRKVSFLCDGAHGRVVLIGGLANAGNVGRKVLWEPIYVDTWAVR